MISGSPTISCYHRYIEYNFGTSSGCKVKNNVSNLCRSWGGEGMTNWTSKSMSFHPIWFLTQTKIYLPQYSKKNTFFWRSAQTYLTTGEKMVFIYVFNIYWLTRARATGLITELRAQIETCVQGGGEKGIARHVRLNKKVWWV